MRSMAIELERSLTGDCFIEVQQHAGDRYPRFLWRRRGLALRWGLQLGKQIEEPLRFIRGGWPRDAQFESVLDSGAVVRAALPLDSVGESACELEELPIVQERERLQRRVRTEPPRARAESIGGIEHREGGVRRCPPPMRVESAAKTIRSFARLPVALYLAKGHHAVGLRRIHRRSAQLCDQRAARGQCN